MSIRTFLHNRTILLSAGLIFYAAMLPGCIYGSLASDTGPSAEGLWSVENMQEAHVGEKVKYSFILREPLNESRLSLFGLAD